MQRNNTYLYIIALTISLLLTASQHAAAREKTAPATEVATDSVPLFNGFAVSADAVGAVQRWVSDYGQYEAALRVNLKDRYFPVIEIGIGQADHNDDVTGIHYKSSAPYGRIGCDFNLLRDKHDSYRLYLGGRYAFTSFNYDLSSPGVSDPVFGGEAVYGSSDVKCRYQWVEVSAGVDAKIAGPLHLGWSVRYRSRLSQQYGDAGEPWYVPGFGKSGSSRIGATFNISLEF